MSKVNITSFSKLVRVTGTENEYGKTTVIEVNRSIPVDILIFCSCIHGVYTIALY